MARKIGADCGAGEENKMTESEVKEIEVKERKRKTNFSPLEISVVTESVIKHIDGAREGFEMKGMGAGLNFYKKSATKFPPNR